MGLTDLGLSGWELYKPCFFIKCLVSGLLSQQGKVNECALEEAIRVHSVLSGLSHDSHSSGPRKMAAC